MESKGKKNKKRIEITNDEHKEHKSSDKEKQRFYVAKQFM